MTVKVCLYGLFVYLKIYKGKAEPESTAPLGLGLYCLLSLSVPMFVILSQ